MMLPKVEEAEEGLGLIESVPDERESSPGVPSQDEMLGVLAHELRNPLTAICNALQISRQCSDDVTTREWVQGVLERQTYQMECLIDGLLNLSRIRRGKSQLQKSPVDLAHVMRLAIETVQPHIDERGHMLEVTLPTVQVVLDADPTWMQQMVTNLLINATKYTDLGGRIWLTVVPEEDEIVLRVRDSGIGIAAEALPHVFDFFWQSAHASSHPQSGLGVGLALVRQIAEMHGGCVTAFSAGPGQGSEFVVHLPRPASAEEHNGAPFADEPSGMGHATSHGHHEYPARRETSRNGPREDNCP